MKKKLLFFIMLSFLLSSCYTRYVYVYPDETTDTVDVVYTYDVNYVYTNLWYDDFYWQYDNVYFGLYYYSPRYWQYPYHYYYEPYYRSYYNYSYYNSRNSHRRHNVVESPHYRHKQPLMSSKPNIRNHQRKNYISPKPPKNNYKSQKKPTIHQKQRNNSSKNETWVYKQRVPRIDTSKKRVEKSTNNQRIKPRRSTKMKPQSTNRTNTKNIKSRKTRR